MIYDSSSSDDEKVGAPVVGLKDIFECFDSAKLQYLIDHPELILATLREGSDPNYDPLVVLRKYLAASKDGQIKVSYNQPTPGYGRHYAEGGLSQQGMPKYVRHTIAGHLYDDLDIKNAHPTILQHMCRTRKIPTPRLSQYIEDRATILDAVAARGRCTTEAAKECILSLLNGGEAAYKKLAHRTGWIKGFRAEMTQIHLQLCADHPTRFEAHVAKRAAAGTTFNNAASFVNTLMCDTENNMLMIMLRYFRSMGAAANDVVLAFDGIQIPRGTNTAALCAGAAAAIEEALGMTVLISCKPMDSIIELPLNLAPYVPSHTRLFDTTQFIARAAKVSTADAYNKLCADIVAEINRFYCFIVATQSYILYEYLGTQDNGQPAPEVIYKSVKSLRDDWTNKNLATAMESKELATLDIYKVWMGSRQRYERVGVQFDPSPKPKIGNKHNLFKGLPYQDTGAPALREDHPFFQHILHRWCHGNQEHYNWCLDWMAHARQRPGTKMDSAIVLMGKEGCGKGCIVKVLADMVGAHHFAHPSRVEDVLGNFNSLLECKLLCFLDELTWGGDKQKAGTLKKMITETTMTINRKNMPIISINNYMNVIIASNSRWVVPAGTTARRWFVVSVSDDLITNEAREDIVRDIINVPRAQLAAFLDARDLTGFSHRRAPITDGLRLQKVATLSPIAQWWLGCIEAGQSDLPITIPWGKAMLRSTLYERFKKEGEMRHTSQALFWRQFKEVAGALEETRPYHSGQRLGRHLTMPTHEDAKERWRIYTCDPGMWKKGGLENPL